ncbi:aminomethyl-transferring glycine dehydrogenase subunit GcvPA [Paeniglutamicibacter sp. ABSL32-1]|uniref:aminomethyl-transferring glycine dehydrogenase subunit GcvPA n=1 Tax=Paeniglutamicibacter quisquiliarum TaxID=2849498 RepID=UPI001C2D4597|nr:aminomethyl-transferring glycine dehydrogenase subunit GcvPA [Paeniglutamicibacter quisquiliarum]MBV1777699.1 aminomethyl-transferring glycine dehydrogenase subunit GcvPA [Paeniglutamicibacter quisquiliarum]
MAQGTTPVHPYVPNSAPATKQAMLEAIGVESIDEFFNVIPEELRMKRPLDIPAALDAEAELQRHMNGLLSRNRPTTAALSFLGSGCYPHHVPAVCDEINQRAEFLTAYAGEPYEDHGKWQALFEYTSLMAELLEMDVVNVPTYDGYQAAATALRMAGRITNRRRVIVADTLAAGKRAKLETFLSGVLTIDFVAPRPETGRIHHDDVVELLGPDTAAVFLETPNMIGVIEADAAEIAEFAHRQGALLVCSTDPLSLGFTEPPARWGADIVCGDIQSLGLGLHFGGANGGFIATHDDERFVFEFPSRLFGLAPTRVEGELGFCDVAYERTSLAMREDGVEWVGTAAALWGITAGAYLALMGPHGMRTLGDTIAVRTREAMGALAEIPGLEVLHQRSAHWREFAVRFPGRKASQVNEALLARGIYGGADATTVFAAGSPDTAVYCTTELHTSNDINALANALKEILS